MSVAPLRSYMKNHHYSKMA